MENHHGEDPLYRGVYLETRPEWQRTLEPVIDFILDHGGDVIRVREIEGRPEIRYWVPGGLDSDIGHMVRLLIEGAGTLCRMIDAAIACYGAATEGA